MPLEIRTATVLDAKAICALVRRSITECCEAGFQIPLAGGVHANAQSNSYEFDWHKEESTQLGAFAMLAYRCFVSSALDT